MHLRVSDVLTSQTDTQLSEVPGQTEGDRIFLVGMSIEEIPYSVSDTQICDFGFCNKSTIDFERQALSEKKKKKRFSTCLMFLSTIEKQIR